MLKTTVIPPARQNAYIPEPVKEGDAPICETYREWNLKGFFFEDGRGWLTPFVPRESTVWVPDFQGESVSLLKQNIEHAGGELFCVGNCEQAAFYKFQATVLVFEEGDPKVLYVSGHGTCWLETNMTETWLGRAQDATELNGAVVRLMEERGETAAQIRQRFDFHGMALTKADLMREAERFWDKVNKTTESPIITRSCRENASRIIEEIPHMRQHLLGEEKV